MLRRDGTVQPSTVPPQLHLSAAQRRGGRELTRWLRLGRPLWAGPSPPCQSTRQANSLQTHARRLPSFHLLASHTLHSAASTSLSLFPFLFLPLHRPHRPCSAFFLFCARTAAISKEASFRVPFAVVVFRLFVVGASRSLLRQSTPTTSSLDLPGSRASTIPPHKNTGRACCLVSLRVSWTPAAARLPLCLLHCVLCLCGIELCGRGHGFGPGDGV